MFQGDLMLVNEERKFDTTSGWTYEYKYRAEQSVVQHYIDNRATLLPEAKTVEAVKGGKAFWDLNVSYGVYLHSTWSLDSSMHEIPLIASSMGQRLDFAFNGWARYIEIKIDEHYAAETAANRFDFDTIKSSVLKEVGGTPAATINLQLGEGTASELDIIAENYAKTYITGVEAFFEPRWIIRNEITLSPAFNFSLYDVLYDDVNKMLSPHWMAAQGLQGGEIIPAGIIVPGVRWWYKQPFKKQQTNENLFILSREWWGLDDYNPFLYEKKL